MAESVVNVASLAAQNLTSYDYLFGKDEVFSPIILDNSIPRISRLVFMMICCSIGTLLNVFFISAFTIEPPLRRSGNVFLACVGLADIIITGGVMTVSSFVLLSDEWNTLFVCKILQVLAETAIYANSIFFMVVSIENYYWVRGSVVIYRVCNTLYYYIVPVVLYAMCFGFAVFGVLKHYDYDYCRRESHGNYLYRIATALAFHFFPGLITVNFMHEASVCIKQRLNDDIMYRHSTTFDDENYMVKSNRKAYVLFILTWVPHFVFMMNRNAGDDFYYYTIWFALFRSSFGNILFGISNKTFRRAYVNLFKYCFLKQNLPTAYARPHRRRRSSRYLPDPEMRPHNIMVDMVHLRNDYVRRPSLIRETQSL